MLPEETTIEKMMDTDYYVSMGEELFFKENFDGALKCFDLALGLQPNCFNALRGKGRSLFYLETRRVAEEYFKDAFEIDPEDGECLLYLGIIANSRDNNKKDVIIKGREKLLIEIEKKGESGKIFYLLGYGYYYLYDYKSAKQYLLNAAKYGISLAEVLLANIFLLLGIPFYQAMKFYLSAALKCSRSAKEKLKEFRENFNENIITCIHGKKRRISFQWNDEINRVAQCIVSLGHTFNEEITLQPHFLSFMEFKSKILKFFLKRPSLILTLVPVAISMMTGSFIKFLLWVLKETFHYSPCNNRNQLLQDRSLFFSLNFSEREKLLENSLDHINKNPRKN